MDDIYRDSLSEALSLVEDHLHEARHADNQWRQGLHLKMASSALREALRFYLGNLRGDFNE